jgi:arylsulfatase A-like enzyme
MRVPGIAWWPGQVKPGSVNRDIACNMDLFTTSLRLAGASVPGDRMIDGLDLSETLLHSAAGPRRTMFYYRGTRLFAARKEQWKLHLFTQRGYGQPKPDAHDPPLLFDLESDPGETFNVAGNHSDVVADILAEIRAHRATVVPVKSQLAEVAPPSTSRR